MTKRRFGRWLVGAALAGSMATACNADQEPTGTAGAGGASGASGSGGKGGTAGSGGSAGSSGAAGSKGSTDAQADQSASPDGSGAPDGTTDSADGASEAAADAAGSDAAAERDGGSDGARADGASDADAGTSAVALFAGSDFVNGKVKIAAIDFSSGNVLGSSLVTALFADAVPSAGAGRGFLIERSDSKLLVLDTATPWTGTSPIDLSGSDDTGLGTNPVAVVNTGAKAYVPLYYKNTIAIVDVAGKSVTGAVDLSQFVDPSDTDGLVDVFDGAYDALSHRAYFLLQRIPQNEQGIEPDRVSHCIAATPLIVGVDTTNDQLVDINGDAGGLAISLLGANPSALVPDLATGRLLVVETGCYEVPEGGVPDGGADAQAALTRSGRGVESVSVTSSSSTWLFRYTGSDRMASVVWVDATHAFVSTNDAFYEPHWFSWNPTMTTLGSEVANFPKYAAKSVRGGRVAGISPVRVDGGTRNAFVAFDVSSGQTTTIAADIFGDSAYGGEYNGWSLLQ